ncbi:peptidoglycan D,D-transpeptidase FtsI family protein [Eubacterium xylanophilum]|uniref:peptidoglycan D,D-transpeptidase FtsI family protein n=1 Tax=Eubacterium xylanophilum TaxID=39497 RepID=UPI0004B3BDDA|nr:penicillin-binding transpeptidase domain-containing protein [Eubacterium xylanophilum]
MKRSESERIQEGVRSARNRKKNKEQPLQSPKPKKKKKQKQDTQSFQETTLIALNKKSNREIAVVTYIFLFLFVFMTGYVMFFLSKDKDQILNNPQNRRQDLLAERVIKGSIQSADGTVLAKTVTGSDGKERREYPFDGLFAHVVGRTSHGRTGIEASESFTLLNSSINPVTAVVNSLKGKKNPGDNVVTTLNVDLTRIASEALGNRKGAVVVMDPSDGSILTMVSKPTYNPNYIAERWEKLINSVDSSSLYNRATQGLYPPGSTFKLYTLLEYMRENKDYKKFTYNCKGKIGTDSESIHCYGNTVHGKLDLDTAFAKSCNSAFAEIGKGLSTSSWTKLCEKFYYNKTMPISEVEQKSARFDLSGLGTGDIMQASIGQGDVLTSPLQNIFLVNAVMNNGTLVKPRLVDHISDTYGNVISKREPEELSASISKKEVKALKEAMSATVSRGTATALQSSNYSAGGKTGSAEFKEGSNDSHAWFVGYAKQGKKCLTISVIVEGAGTGGAHAVPIARRIFDAYFL